MQAQDTILYQRKDGYIPRVAAVHDLCGYGKCSCGVAIPVLSAAGADVCPVPTSLFSAHTKFPVFYMHDTTDMLNDYLDAWQKEGVELDAIYSGFLGSAEQVAIIKRMWHEYPRALRIVDPVMGDAGSMYPTYTQELCDSMKQLVDGADLLTPNLTEAALLCDAPYTGQDISHDEVVNIIDALCAMGAKNVVLKGVCHNDGRIRNYVGGQNCDIAELDCELLPYMLHGTGDLFAASMAGAIMAGKDLYTACEFAGNFVHDAMEITQKQPDFELRGVSFEPLLYKMCDLQR